MKLRAFAFIGVLGVSASALAAPEPSQKDIDVAIDAALDVRDSNDDDHYVDVAGAFVVEEVDVRLALEYARFERTKGAEGVPRRTSLEEANQQIVVVPIPSVVQAAIRARDEYIARVAPNKDREKNAILYAFDNADVFFVYGQFAEARARFERIYGERGLSDEWGRKSWEKLIAIAAKSHDTDRAEALACANPTSDLSKDVVLAASYERAETKFTEACGRELVTSADRCIPAKNETAVWADAAQRYEDVFRAAPRRKEAARAALRAAFAWKQARKVARAIAVYEAFIRDTSTDTPSLELAYGELALTYHAGFAYSKAADTYAALANQPRFGLAARKDAALNAMQLDQALGRRDRLAAEHAITSKLALTDEERANADFLLADSPRAFANFHARWEKAPFPVVLEAAWKVAKSTKRGDAGRRAWLEKTVASWQRVGKNAAPYSEWAAEAEFTLIDDELAEKHPSYVTLATDEVMPKYNRDAREAQTYETRLQHVIQTYASPTFIAAALARQGSLYDSLRSALFECGGSRFKVVPPKLAAVLAQLRETGKPDLVEKADAVEMKFKEVWAKKRDAEIDANDAVMIRRYVQAVTLAKAYDIKTPAIGDALSRLEHFTEANLIEEAKLEQYVTTTPDPIDPTKMLEYTKGMFAPKPRVVPALAIFDRDSAQLRP